MPLVHLFLRLFLCACRQRAGRNLFRERELIRFHGHHGPCAFQTLAAMSGLSTFSIARDWISRSTTILMKRSTSLLNFANCIKFRNFFTHDKRRIIYFKEDEDAFYICIKYFCIFSNGEEFDDLCRRTNEEIPKLLSSVIFLSFL